MLDETIRHPHSDFLSRSFQGHDIRNEDDIFSLGFANRSSPCSSWRSWKESSARDRQR